VSSCTQLKKESRLKKTPFSTLKTFFNINFLLLPQKEKGRLHYIETSSKSLKQNHIHIPPEEGVPLSSDEDSVEVVEVSQVFGSSMGGGGGGGGGLGVDCLGAAFLAITFLTIALLIAFFATFFFTIFLTAFLAIFFLIAFLAKAFLMAFFGAAFFLGFFFAAIQ